MQTYCFAARKLLCTLAEVIMYFTRRHSRFHFLPFLHQHSSFMPSNVFISFCAAFNLLLVQFIIRHNKSACEMSYTAMHSGFTLAPTLLSAIAMNNTAAFISVLNFLCFAIVFQLFSVTKLNSKPLPFLSDQNRPAGIPLPSPIKPTWQPQLCFLKTHAIFFEPNFR
jgi:hypothetical protein